MAQTLLQRVMCETPLDEMGDRVGGGEHVSRTIGLFHRDIGLQALQAAGPPVSRASEGVRNMLLTRTPLYGMNFDAAEFDAGGSIGTEQYSHCGRHELGDRSLILHAGDSLDFKSRSPHRIHNHTNDTALLHWVIRPAPRSGRSKP